MNQLKRVFEVIFRVLLQKSKALFCVRKCNNFFVKIFLRKSILQEQKKAV